MEGRISAAIKRCIWFSARRLRAARRCDAVDRHSSSNPRMWASAAVKSTQMSPANPVSTSLRISRRRRSTSSDVWKKPECMGFGRNSRGGNRA